MNIYIVSATDAEVKNTKDYCNLNFKINEQGFYKILDTINLKIISLGVGVPATIYGLCKLKIKPTDTVIQAGIAGSFTHLLAIGNVYCVGVDRFADIGVQDNKEFLDVFEIGLEEKNNFPYTNGMLFNLLNPIPAFFNGLMLVNAITVNTVSGNLETINLLKTKYKPTLESMEGAALHYYCLQENISFVQLRAVSNFVEVRDKSKWNIPLAIENLNNTLIDYIINLQK